MGIIGFGFAPEQKAYAVWDNAPGGTVVERWTDNDGQGYVLVEFEKSPGALYVYFAE